MVCNNGGIYGFLGAWSVLIDMVPCNRRIMETPSSQSAAVERCGVRRG